jgi:hypothetical protein
MFPTKAAIDMDDLQYPESWRSDHHAPGEVRAAQGQETVKPAANGKINTWE